MKQVVVGMGDGSVSRDPDSVLVTYALGSCIALMIHDPVAQVSGMVHFMLPASFLSDKRTVARPWMYADTGIALLLQAAVKLGANARRLVICAAGGATVMDDEGVFDIGKRNCVALRRVLWKFGLVPHAEETGGALPRTVRMEVGTGQVWLQTAGQEMRKFHVRQSGIPMRHRE